MLYGLDGMFPRRFGRPRMGELFQVGESIVAVRCAQIVRNGRPYHLLIDDDIPSAIADETLPLTYRKRLKNAWRNSAANTGLDEIDSVVVPSDALEEIYRSKGKNVIRLDPYWPVPSEFPERSVSTQRAVDVAFLGTGSHVGDLSFLREALESTDRIWNFHHFLGPHAPDWLRTLPRVIARTPSSWRSYRLSLGKLRFDICVYPSKKSAVNRARSCNKIMEHAMTGSLSLYGENVPFADKVEAIDRSLLVGDREWEEAIGKYATDPIERNVLAREIHATAYGLAVKSKARQARVWRDLSLGHSTG